MANDLVYGVDFGTSNTAIAVRSGRGPSRVLAIGRGGAEVERSLLYFPNSVLTPHSVGANAIDAYLADDMAGRLIQSVKSLLPEKGFDGTDIHGKHYTVERLVSLILTELKARADAITGGDARKAVMGRPALFSEDPEEDALAERRLRKAAELAGFEEIRFQREPVAAAFAYETRLRAPELALVGDIGAGTSDFTLMRLDPNRAIDAAADRAGDIVATGGVHLGGDDFDAEIMWRRVAKHFGHGGRWKAGGKWFDLPNHIYRLLCRWEESAFLKDRRVGESLERFRRSTDQPKAVERLIALIEGNLSFALFQHVEGAKKALSSESKGVVDFKAKRVSLREEISLRDFEALCAELVGNLEATLDRFMANAGVAPGDVDAVFLTGGATFVRTVRAAFATRFGEGKIRDGGAFTSVATGLAQCAESLFAAPEPASR